MPTSWLRPYNPQPVKAILAELGLSQAELCRRYGLEKTNLTKIVNGRLTVSEPFAEALTEATGLPIGVLFEPDLYVRTHWYARKLREERAAAGGERDE
jgi:transcriptional regulator with XRE-family HTH domain